MPPKKKIENTVNIIKETLEKNLDSETKKTIKKETKKKSIVNEVISEESKQSLGSTIKEMPSTSLIEQHLTKSNVLQSKSPVLIEPIVEEKKKTKNIKKEKLKDSEKEPNVNQENIEKQIDEERNKFKILLEESNKIEKDLEIARNNFKKLLNESNEIEKNLEITRTNLKNLLDKLKINDTTIQKNNIKKETTIEISDTD